jgi:hypothetical protein
MAEIERGRQHAYYNMAAAKQIEIDAEWSCSI